ncbi:sigma-70 family RNA polymerase sigma factor [Verrucomicrobiota bacterium sgz303538]
MTDPSSDSEPSPFISASAEAFASELAALMPGLRAYVTSILPGYDRVDDVVQEASALIWSRRAEFVPGTNFAGWAMRFAYFTALAHRRDAIRGGARVVFSEVLVQQVAERAAERAGSADARLDALEKCLGELKPADAALIQARYGRDTNLTALAAQQRKSPEALHKAISRLRAALRLCVRRRLGEE